MNNKIKLILSSLLVELFSILFPCKVSGESNLEVFKFSSKHLNSERDIIVYLPPSYCTLSNKRYPVLYALDGQNLFDPKTAFMNNHWRLKETLDALIKDKLIEEIIVVGIYNAGINRINEYTFSFDNRVDGKGAGGDGLKHAQFLVEELKPFIDNKYRTLSNSKNTAIMGSSLGALASIYTATKYPEVFSKVICMSPSFWWNNRKILDDIDSWDIRPDIKIYIDGGHKEGKKLNNKVLTSFIEDMRSVYFKLLEKKLKIYDNLLYYEDINGEHNEFNWAKRVYNPLIYMFGKFKPNIQEIKLQIIPTNYNVNSMANVFIEILHPYNVLETRLYGDFFIDNNDIAYVNNEGYLFFKKLGEFNLYYYLDNKIISQNIKVTPLKENIELNK